MQLKSETKTRRGAEAAREEERHCPPLSSPPTATTTAWPALIVFLSASFLFLSLSLFLYSYLERRLFLAPLVEARARAIAEVGDERATAAETEEDEAAAAARGALRRRPARRSSGVDGDDDDDNGDAPDSADAAPGLLDVGIGITPPPERAASGIGAIGDEFNRNIPL